MDWAQAKEDTYYRARRLEAEARETGTAEEWRQFAVMFKPSSSP